MFFTDDPIRDHLRYEAEITRELTRRPICFNCGEHIQSETFYEINNRIVCPDCLESDYARSVEDYISDVYD